MLGHSLTLPVSFDDNVIYFDTIQSIVPFWISKNWQAQVSTGVIVLPHLPADTGINTSIYLYY